MVDPVGVIEPVRRVVVLEQLFVSPLQQQQVFAVQPGVPDVVQDGHLLKLAAAVVLQRRWFWRRDRFGPPVGRRQAGLLQEEALALPQLFNYLILAV